eukprot:g12006.t1
MKYVSKTFALLCAVMMLTLPALAEQDEQAIPTQAVGEDTMLALYVDVSQIDAEMISGVGEGLLSALAGLAQMQGDDFGLPLGDPQEMIDNLTTLRGSFVQAGGEGLVMTVEMPGEDSWSPPMSLLAKTNDKFDAKAMGATIRTMGDGQMDATMNALGGGWQTIALKNDLGEAVTSDLPDPDQTAFTALNKQLTQHEKPVIALAFRMQDELRLMMDEAEEMAKDAQQQGATGEDAQAQMMLGLMMGMFKPIRSLDTVGLAISEVDGGMLVDAKMTFLDATSAQQFSNLYNSIIMFAPVIIAGTAQGELENMPDPATINQFFMQLKMQIDGNTLSLTLDQEFFDMAEKIAPLLELMQGEIGSDLDL